MPIGDWIRWIRCCKATEGDARATRRRGKFPDYLKFYHETIQKHLGNMKPIKSLASLRRIKYVTKKGDGQRVECIFTHFVAKKGHPVKQGTGFTTDLDTSDTNLHTALNAKSSSLSFLPLPLQLHLVVIHGWPYSFHFLIPHLPTTPFAS